jgi:hypothetical protein
LHAALVHLASSDRPRVATRHEGALSLD